MEHPPVFTCPVDAVRGSAHLRAVSDFGRPGTSRGRVGNSPRVGLNGHLAQR
ncbi:hypothetical protein JKA73_15610 [Myxococcus xanthus]|uniref:hypothetical protein n=1 Tax=Myxococcus xanthus TaxID=34 RepID=UPI0019173B80|nr:hypothetical protein [Myxococcus xanthus]QQR47393.1 hypothetical protein JKA73_15610 [Myxococcus xanthus]